MVDFGEEEEGERACREKDVASQAARNCGVSLGFENHG